MRSYFLARPGSSSVSSRPQELKEFARKYETTGRKLNTILPSENPNKDGRCFAISYPEKLAFIFPSTSTNTKLHELGHIENFSFKSTKNCTEEFILQELAAEDFVASTKGSNSLSFNSVLKVLSSAKRDLGVSSKAVVRAYHTVSHKLGYSVPPSFKKDLLRCLVEDEGNL